MYEGTAHGTIPYSHLVYNFDISSEMAVNFTLLIPVRHTSYDITGMI
jgi:hypothetical protein